MAKQYYFTQKKLIALASTIYKFYTSILVLLLTNYGKQHQILQYSQKGFRHKENSHTKSKQF